MEVIFGCLDSPHKGTVKSAEDCLKTILQVMSKKALGVGEVVLPLIHRIPTVLRRRKMLSLIHTVEYLKTREELKEVVIYIKFALESVLEDTSIMRMGSLCVEAILVKLKKVYASTEEWLSAWCDDFIDTLCKSREKILLLSNSIVNVVLAIDPNALPLIILKVLGALSSSYKNELLVVLLALLVEARRQKKLKYTDSHLIISDQLHIAATPELINLIFDLADTNAVLLALNLCAANPKTSELPENIDRMMFQKAVQISSTNTYDDYREKHMKLCQKYIGELRAKHHTVLKFNSQLEGKEDTKVEVKKAEKEGPKKILAKQEEAKMLEEALKKLKTELTSLISIAASKLRIDGGFDTVFPHLCVLKALWETFPDVATSWKLYSLPNTFFCIQSLSSSWEVLRNTSYAVLENYPIEVLSPDDWQFSASHALANLCSPRSIEAEGAALFMKLLYNKNIALKGFDIAWDQGSTRFATTVEKYEEGDLMKKQLRWIRIMINRIKCKRVQLNESLFKRASCEDLMHGELRFINVALSGMRFEQSATKNPEWKAIIQIILDELQTISDYCEGLLSSTGIIDEETGNIVVDCRGRLSQMNPEIKQEIAKAASSVKSDYYFAIDYENLLSTGIWLIAKESGNLYKTLAEWLVFPGYGAVSWLTHEEVKAIACNLLDKILAYKHRGAFLKLVEALQVIVSKCIRSNSPEMQALPGFLLDQIFGQIKDGTIETNKTLRRSAGIPHSILAILRSEAYPILLDKTIKWMLEHSQSPNGHESRVHSLNIIKAIFDDSDIKQDIQSFTYNALMVATEGLSDPQWKIRNSSLMVFTAATKRIFGSCSTSEEHLNRQAKSVYEFFGYSDVLCKFMLTKLKECGTKNDPNTKFAIYPILLLFSRLAPSPYAKTKMHMTIYVSSFKEEIMKMLGHADIGIREISAKALIPLIDPSSYLNEAFTCITAIQRVGQKKAFAHANLVHGMLELALRLVKMHFHRPSSTAEMHLAFLKTLSSINFLLTGPVPLLHMSFYRILNKFMKQDGVTKEIMQPYFAMAQKACLNHTFEEIPAYTNSIRQKIDFIISKLMRFIG